MDKKEMVNQVIASYINSAKDKNNISIGSGLLEKDVNQWCKAHGYEHSRKSYGMGITIVTIHKIQ